jgi:beta-phosphoglucomutase
MKNIEGILFDFDGVLADTMDDNYKAWKKACRKFGADISKQEYFALEGMKLIETAKLIGHKYNLSPEDYKGIVDLKNKFYLRECSFKFYPGVIELVEKLYSKVKMCIVSASPRHKIENTVPKEFLDKFDAIVSGDDTEKGKPDPAPYLMGCKKLNLLPQECIVFENAPLGIKSAKSAGIYCAAISSTLDKEFLKDADLIIEKFEDLQNIDVIKNVLAD